MLQQVPDEGLEWVVQPDRELRQEQTHGNKHRVGQSGEEH